MVAPFRFRFIFRFYYSRILLRTSNLMPHCVVSEQLRRLRFFFAVRYSPIISIFQLNFYRRCILFIVILLLCTRLNSTRVADKCSPVDEFSFRPLIAGTATRRFHFPWLSAGVSIEKLNAFSYLCFFGVRLSTACGANQMENGSSIYAFAFENCTQSAEHADWAAELLKIIVAAFSPGLTVVSWAHTFGRYFMCSPTKFAIHSVIH